MVVQHQLPGVRSFLWLRNVALRTGILTGIYLSIVFLAWLLVANRFPQLKPFAEARNLVGGAMMFTMLSIPLIRFRRKPGRMFVSGVTAWILLTVTYLSAEVRFPLLESRMGALHIFTLGAVSYGFVAVLDWVFLTCAEIRQHHIARSREAAVSPSMTRFNS